MSVSRETSKALFVSRETKERLFFYEALLKKWSPKINLVSSPTLEIIWERHFYDSLQLMEYIPESSNCLVDLGSGAGFPGMVLAVAGQADVHLVEVDKRKCVFLQEVARELSLNVTVHACLIQDYKGPLADIVTSRALAPLKKLIDYGQKMVKPFGKGLFLKGKKYQEEIDLCNNKSMDLKVFPSKINNEGAIIQVEY